MLHLRALGQGLVDRGLEGGRLAAAVAAVGGDDQLGVGVLDPGGDGVGGEPAEDHRVRGTDAGAGEHRDDGLGDHRQVDRHPVALADTELQQRIGGLGDLVLELCVGDRATVTRLALEVDGDPLAMARLDMPVDAVVGHVELAVGEPLGKGRVGPVQCLGRLDSPAEAARLLGPEAEAVLGRLGIRGLGDVGARGGSAGGAKRRSSLSRLARLSLLNANSSSSLFMALSPWREAQCCGIRPRLGIVPCVPVHSSSGEWGG